jgi:hypothetical protein
LLDFANTRVLDPRITFTRASTATFYDNDTSAVAEQNLLLQSQAFDSASWTKSGGTITANVTIAPDGTTTAAKFIEASGTVNPLVYEDLTLSAVTYTRSIYAKAAERSILQIYLNNANPVGNPYFNFDLSAGTITSGGSGATATITSIGNGWYRCTTTWTSLGGTGNLNLYKIALNTTDTRAQTYTGDGASGLYIWGAQLEQRSTVTAYTPTTTAAITNYIPVMQTAASGAARFTCDPVTRESLGLLIEESRTNLLTYSSAVGGTNWTVQGGVTVNLNDVISPDGTQNSTRIVGTTSNALFESVTLTAGATYTLSAFIKAGTSTIVSFGLLDTTAGTFEGRLFVRWTDGVPSQQSVQGSVSNVSFTPHSNGWYRVSVSIPADSANTAHRYYFYPDTTAASGSVYIWGAQLEAGAFATSYIPTVASQVTRAADAASMTGTNFSSWYNIAEGSLYVEGISVDSIISSTARQYMTINNNTSATIIALEFRLTNQSRFNVLDGGASVALLSSGGTINQNSKLAGSYKTNNFNVTTNGAGVGTDTLGNIPTVSQMNIGGNSTNSAIASINGTLKRIAYYPVRLSNTELQGLTA